MVTLLLQKCGNSNRKIRDNLLIFEILLIYFERKVHL